MIKCIGQYVTKSNCSVSTDKDTGKGKNIVVNIITRIQMMGNLAIKYCHSIYNANQRLCKSIRFKINRFIDPAIVFFYTFLQLLLKFQRVIVFYTLHWSHLDNEDCIETRALTRVKWIFKKKQSTCEDTMRYFMIGLKIL